MIAASYLDDVLQTVNALLARLAPPDGYRELFVQAIKGVSCTAKRSQAFLPLDLPLAVASALSLPRRQARIAAAACALLWAGADLMDDHADGDLHARWQRAGVARLALVWTNLLATFPHLLAAEVRDPERLATFHREASLALWKMSVGQFADLAGGEAVHNADEYLNLVRLKTGAETALFASCPVILGGASATVVRRWAHFGEAYGCMAQVYSDTASAVAPPPHSDLLRGKRSLPVLRALDVLRGPRRAAFASDLALAARGDSAAVERAVARMKELHTVSFALANVEVLRHRAAVASPIALAALDLGHPLRRMMWAFSVT
jgi:geranylgeranyl pyrophosphate synthase